MNQPVPNVSDADVERIVRRDFPAGAVAEVLATLAAYGPKTWHREVARVRLAILKLAGGDLARLHRALATADTDFRDVLASAEYPAYLTNVPPSGPVTEQHREAIESDWAQYRRWFEQP